MHCELIQGPGIWPLKRRHPGYVGWGRGRVPGRKLADTKGTKEAGQVYEAGQRQRMRRVYASRWTRCRTAASKHSWS
ncbi:hypothetical protein COCCADRAFT_89784 [Bipolaris zeicola 26-R-13]|uniref:Uncharacterized protein n=1 Tax=Cochliobolus carbonum (strain 26-R-13) TaxID=930089 RepID=W6YDV1_COCC2|nr:uncharacterized protein COCCADRAFT_89784 [Bipolaris zeicola 26-R-13]EUC35835.1 hypothetical protein COCCADRAFT_89784 [Bipolaris zeicola 26-R-13]